MNRKPIDILIENLYELVVERKEDWSIQFDDGIFGSIHMMSRSGDWSISGKPRWAFTITAGADYRPAVKVVKGCRVKVRRGH